jgi:hypothetical protein
MKFAAIITAGAVLGLAGPALAADCVRPEAPAPVDGATATMEQLVAAKTAVTDFIAKSDAYQTCVLDDVAAQKDAAKKAKTKFDPAISKAADAKVSENQADKERVGQAFNAAAKAYKAAHPS